MQTIKDPIPENFATLDEAAEFWDSHDLTDYWDETEEAEFLVRLQRRSATNLATLEKRE